MIRLDLAQKKFLVVIETIKENLANVYPVWGRKG